MQYTSNYNLMLPEGTDIVNLLTQLNPNISDIDAAMFANKQMSVGRATESTTGTVHAITRANQNSPIFAFTATSNWTQGDTMSVDGVSCSVYLTDGTQPATGSYVINAEVLAIVQGSRVTLLSSHAALSLADVQAEINANLPKVLWTNASPNTPFAAQQIILNSNDYDYIEVFSRNGIVEKAMKNQSQFNGYYPSYGSDPQTELGINMRRTFAFVDDTTISVSDCIYLAGTYNNGVVPTYVIGHKLHQ